MFDVFKILRKRAFSAVFVTQFTGAFNDNIFRAAMSGFVTYKLVSLDNDYKQIIVTLAVGLFMLPFFLFSAIAGEMADKYRKDVIFKITKCAEVAIVSLAVFGFWVESPILLLAVLFLMGMQSAFFGPAKYSVLPDVLKKDELISGNALFEAGTYLAILLGIIIGGIIMSFDGSGLAATSTWIISVAVIGLASSLFIPKIKAASPSIKISKNFLKLTWKNMKFATIKREIFLCIMGISWFWLIGAVLISQIPGYAQNVLNADGGVYTFLLTLFSCGIGVGAILCQSLLKGEINSKYVPVSAVLMTLFLADLAIASMGISVGEEVQSFWQFITTKSGLRISFDLLCLAAAGGLYMVPLNAMLQTFAEEKVRSRVIATNNIINSLFMVAGSGICAALLAQGVSIAGIFAIMAAANAFAALYICGLLPQHSVKLIAKSIIKFFYKIEIKGEDNLKNLKGEAVIIANHTSFLDAALLWLYLPDDVFFAINTHIAEQWWVKPFLHLVKYFPIDPINPMGVKSIIDEVKNGRKVVIFPEGRITTTGALMKVYPGPAVIADKSDADILPICFEGAQYSVLAKFAQKFKKRPNSKVRMTILPPRKLDVDPELTGKVRRQAAAAKLYDVMRNMKFVSSNTNKTLFRSLVKSYKFVGGNKPILEDISRKPLSFKKFLIAIFALGDKMAKVTKEKEYVGLLLPNSIGAVAAFFGLSAMGRVPAMINFSGGVKNILSCCKAAAIKTIYTSEEFVERADLFEVVEALKKQKINVINLEDVKKKIGLADKIAAMWKAKFPIAYSAHDVKGDDAAVVLFTSGSEGLPKGVVLSHRNIQANRVQMASSVDFGPLDSFFNAMPIFHSFGLTAGLLLPLMTGIKVFMYPSPLHYRIVPELIYDTNSTVMFGTDTFLNGYARVAHPYDFYSIRFAVAGAEKVKEETFNTWYDKFGVRIFEGYGATETAPILAINLPMNFKRGTVGKLLPGIEAKVEKVPGYDKGGRLIVEGPNVMLGYLKADKPGVLQPLKDGWYDTGDIVAIDDEGFVSILGRAKRFAKVAGEMISLLAVESEVSKIWSDEMHAVVAVPDEKKGEKLILYTTQKDADSKVIWDHFKKTGMTELAVPKIIKAVEKIPLMGTGKTDYVLLNEMAKELGDF